MSTDKRYVVLDIVTRDYIYCTDDKVAAEEASTKYNVYYDNPNASEVIDLQEYNY